MPIYKHHAPHLRSRARFVFILLATLLVVASPHTAHAQGRRRNRPQPTKQQPAAPPSTVTANPPTTVNSGVHAAIVPPKASVGQITGRTTWDERYVYFAFQVDDPDVQGISTAPLSRADKDDSVGVYLQIGDKRPDAPDTNTHAMIVSVAGGFTFLRGDEQQHQFVTRPLFTIKYAVSIQGTLNRGDDRDKGYTVEMAIPWEAMGVKPEDLKPGFSVGFAVVARTRLPGNKMALTSLAPDVQTEADVANPSHWSRLTLVGIQGDAGANGGRIAPQVAPNYAPPLIDGVIRNGEWPNLSRYVFAAPEKPSLPVAVIPAPAVNNTNTVAPFLRVDSNLSSVNRLLLARYVINVQGDTRRPAPFRGVRSPNGAFLLRDQPAGGAGPWFSSDRVSWHRGNLMEMQRVGIHATFVEFGAPSTSTAAEDDKALLALVAAQREMAFEQLESPRLALWLDTRAIANPDGTKIDLLTDAGRAALYNAVARFMRRVPPELRLAAPLPIGAGGARAYPVMLSDAAPFTNIGSAWADDLRTRFAGEFGANSDGVTLLFMGGESWDKGNGNPNLASIFPTEQGGAGSGPIGTYVVQPGLDTSAALTPRRDTETYKTAWESALDSKAHWIIIDSWNDFGRGTEIAASRQYGPRYAEMTRLYALQGSTARVGNGGLEARQSITWLGHNLPRQMRPGETVVSDILVQNNGLVPLRGGAGATIGYRWVQNGKTVAEGPVRFPLRSSLFPADRARLSLGIESVRPDAGGKMIPLPPGKYTLQIELGGNAPLPARPVTSAGRGPAADADNSAAPVSVALIPLRVPVTITPDAPEGVEFASTTTPTLTQTGSAAPVLVRVRWTGREAIPVGSAQLSYQITTDSGQETIATASFPVDVPLPPGRWTTLRAFLRLSDSGGAPLPAAYPENLGGDSGGATGYRLRWLLSRTDATTTLPGEYMEHIAVYPGDDEARILPPGNVPATMDAGAQVPVEVTIINRGTGRWLTQNTWVGYHWYYADGVEAVWQPALTARLPRDLNSGASTKVTVPLVAPERDGLYILAFDVARGAADAYLSTRPLTRSGDVSLAYVRVTGGRLTFVDLGNLYNIDGVASEERPADGDLNGAGSTLPAESFPPDRYGINAVDLPDPRSRRANREISASYPSGYYSEVSAARVISFRYGSDADGAKNAVACAGQTVNVPHRRYVGLHIAALATGGSDQPIELTLHYGGKTQTLKATVGDWNRTPQPGEPVAIRATRRRTPQGDVRATCAVYHILLPVSVERDLQSITLPSNPKVKIFAITLEQ